MDKKMGRSRPRARVEGVVPPGVPVHRIGGVLTEVGRQLRGGHVPDQGQRWPPSGSARSWVGGWPRPTRRAKPRHRHRQSTWSRPASRIHCSCGPDPGQAILGVVLGSADEGQELGVELGGGGGHHFEVGEQPAGSEPAGDLGEQALLAVVVQMMDGESRDDHVERAQRLDRVGEVPGQHRHPAIAGEAVPGPLQHGGRVVDGDDPAEGGAGLEGQGGQSAVPASEVEEGSGLGRQHRPEHVLARRPRRQTRRCGRGTRPPGGCRSSWTAGSGRGAVPLPRHHCAPAALGADA